MTEQEPMWVTDYLRGLVEARFWLQLQEKEPYTVDYGGHQIHPYKEMTLEQWKNAGCPPVRQIL